MSVERKPFIITVDGQDHEMSTDNHGVAMFRNTPEYDYIDLTVEVGPEEEEKHILIFRHQWLCHWMGGLALNQADRQRLNDNREELGNFAERFGWNSKVLVEDAARDFEIDMYAQSMLGDLKDTDSVPEGWGG